MGEMRIRRQFRDKAAWFLGLTREDEPRPIQRIPHNPAGMSALEAFYYNESRGWFVETREPLLLERYLAGKMWHGVLVANCAEMFAIERLLFSAEIKHDYPSWVADEIFSQAGKLCRKKLGFVPPFVLNRKDLSEF